ncbi:thioredoxin [Ligilactobacillus ceti]|nr:thioredoxin [Ligilactobacillus ceti]
MVKELNDATFTAETGNGLSLVDFWAPWCGPCRMQGPVIEQVAAEVGDSVKVAKMNVDENQGVAAQLGIMSIPTMLVIKDGQIKETLVGYHPKEQLMAILGKYM